MDHSSAFGIGDLGNPVFRPARSDPAGVVDLPAASRIKSSTIQSDRWPRRFGDVANLAFKFVEKRVAVVEPVGHAPLFYLNPHCRDVACYVLAGLKAQQAASL